MEKKSVLITLCFLFSVSLTSCSFFKEIGNYEKLNDTYYFEDYETMKNVIIPEINTAFSNWYWSSAKFDDRFNKYLNNIEPNTDNADFLKDSLYSYAVKVNTSGKTVHLKKQKETDMDKTISGKYFWITTKENEAVVFFQN